MKLPPQKKHMFLRIILILLIAILFLAASVFATSAYVKMSTKNSIISTDDVAKLDDIDCIIVLGAGVWNNQPSHILNNRLTQGVALYNLGASKRLLMSGDHGEKGYDEVNVMKNFALDRGVPSEHVFMDHAGFSTYESMYRARDVFEAQRVIIVTQEYHLYRALYISKAMGLEAYGIASDLREYRGQTYYTLREHLARAKDVLSVIFMPLPTYLGNAIPVSGNGDATNDYDPS